MNKDIVIKDEENNYRFNYRVGAVFTNKDKVLLQKSEKDSYYSLIGGRVKYNETTKQALIREIKEEVGITILESDLVLINVAENFFTYGGTNIHELLFIYKIIDNIELKNKDNIKTLDKDDVINKWFSISDIMKMDVRPKIFIVSLNSNSITDNIIN